MACNFANVVSNTYTKSTFTVYTDHAPAPVYGYKEPLPLDSYGNRRAINPAVMKTAPAIKIGTGVFKFAYNAITGAYIDPFNYYAINLVKRVSRTITPQIRFPVAVKAFPVPLSLVGNSSGVMAYSTPYMMLLVKLYAQFHPSRELELRAVVEIKMRIPVRAV